MVSRPFDLLNDALGKEALVILKAGRQVQGVLLAFDVHMNLVIDDAVLTDQDGTEKKLGRILVRGDTVVLVAPSL
jgi:small nuclear ribonucleoprotein (snRNP)-like protein